MFGPQRFERRQFGPLWFAPPLVGPLSFARLPRDVLLLAAWRPLLLSSQVPRSMSKLTTRRPGRPPNAAQRAERRSQILSAAAEVFATRGYAATDLALVAGQVGIAKGTIYLYFRSKSALFLAAVDEGMNRLREAVDAAHDSSDDALEALALAIRAYLDFFENHPQYVELLIQERAQFRDRRKPTYFVHRDAHRDAWRARIADLIAEGRVRAMPVDRVLDVVGDLLYGTMFTDYFAGRRQTVEEQYRDVVDIVFAGILSDEQRLLRAAPRRSRPKLQSGPKQRSGPKRRTGPKQRRSPRAKAT